MSLIPRITAGWQDAFWVFRNNAPESLNNSPKNAEVGKASAFFNLIYLSRSQLHLVIYPPHQRFIDLSLFAKHFGAVPSRSRAVFIRFYLQDYSRHTIPYGILIHKVNIF